MKLDRGDFEFDFALSFAGENRAIVKKFAALLKAKGLSVFYDDWNRANLWGRDLYQHLDEVYSKKARFCVVFISTEYAQKAWTNHELKSAQARAFQENREYILPVRLDDTEIPGIRDTVGFLDIRKMTIEEIAEIAIQKIASPTVLASPTPKGTVKAAPELVIDNSKDWILLNDGFYQAQSVDRPDDKRFIVTLVTNDAEPNARLEILRSQGNFSHPQISFAYASDAFLVRCESASSVYEAGAHKWRLTLLKQDPQQGGSIIEMGYSSGGRQYSARDIAHFRAERILLGSHSTQAPSATSIADSFLEALVSGNNRQQKVSKSPLQELPKNMRRDNATQFLIFARLKFLFHLKSGNVVEHIERLALGPLKGDSVHVIFRGRRHAQHQNIAAELIEVEGDCQLP